MSIVISVAFRAQPTAEEVARIRNMVPKAQFVASIPATANPTGLGFDSCIFHLNTDATGPERNLFYANNIFTPLARESVKHGDVMLTLHDNVTVRWQDSKTLATLIDRIPSLFFASARPLMVMIPGQGEQIVDYPNRFVAWRSGALLQWLAPFTTEEAKNCESSLLMIMNRMKGAGQSPESAWTFQMDILVQENNPPPPVPPP